MEKSVALDSARSMADWFLNMTAAPASGDLLWGTFYYHVERDPARRFKASQWNQAFALMGLLSAGKVFDEKKYLHAADKIVRVMKTLQIFDPFLPEAYGAIREQAPVTPWCYVRDALSGAWGFLEYYRVSGQEEFLQRAILWGEWFLKYGMDETGWPLWGVQLDKYLPETEKPQMCNDMHGSFQGGCLNFFYHLYKETGDKKWVGSFFEHIADYFCTNIQQQDGFFRTIEKATGKVPPDDPQNGHHRGNDDLGSLGLLCAYRVYPKKLYVNTINRFLSAVFAKQLPDGHFETSCAAIPVILNTIKEAGNLLTTDISQDAVEKALNALIQRQFPANDDPLFAGALNETNIGAACCRSTSYALLYLLKEFGGDNRFLAGK